MREIARRGGKKTAATHDMAEIGRLGGKACQEAYRKAEEDYQAALAELEELKKQLGQE